MGIIKSQLGIAIGKEQAPLDLAEQVAPAAVRNKVRLYSKSVRGASEFFVRDDLGNEIRVTNKGVVGGSIRDQLVVNEYGVVQKMTSGIASCTSGDPGTYAVMLNTPLTLYGIGPYIFSCAEHLSLTLIGATTDTAPVFGSVVIVSPAQVLITTWAWSDGTPTPALYPFTFAIFIDP